MPLDPRLNDASRFSPHFQRVAALSRALVKFERWDEILRSGSIPWGTSNRDSLTRLHAEAAESGIAAFDRVKALGIRAEPVDRSPAPQRNYLQTTLDQYGPAIWRPFTAPELTVTDPTGRRLTLDQYRGRNVILVFYLGVGCAHCVLQVRDLSERAAEWAALDADVIAVSQDTPALNAKSETMSPLKVTLTSDTDYDNARRFIGAPFTDYAFLASQLRRMNNLARAQRTSPTPVQSAAERAVCVSMHGCAFPRALLSF